MAVGWGGGCCGWGGQCWGGCFFGLYWFGAGGGHSGVKFDLSAHGVSSGLLRGYVDDFLSLCLQQQFCSQVVIHIKIESWPSFSAAA
ncbi:hypothetical protein U1Q18_018276 [Sarracenia purpurea var. burkii]